MVSPIVPTPLRTACIDGNLSAQGSSDSMILGHTGQRSVIRHQVLTVDLMGVVWATALAMRTGGQHQILAVSALFIGGLFLGVFLGNYIVVLWIM